VGSLGDPVLLVLINAGDLGMDCPREHEKLHFFSHLFRDPVEAYSSALSFGAFVMVQKESE
jgi:hypothetical protein